jgi:hypothetical protein
MRGLARSGIVFFIAALLAAAAPAPALALDLDAAKAQGLLGERADGYVGVVPASAAPEVVKLAAEVNAKRRAHYERIAAETGTSLDAVAARAGHKLIDKAPSGQYVMRDGGWTKKP